MWDHSHDTGTGIHALADRRRRRALSELAEREPPISVGELAAAVNEAETDGGSAVEPATDHGATSGDAATATATVADDGARAADAARTDRERRVAAALYHAPLPKLDDAGYVTFDSDSKVISDWRIDGQTVRL
jgi:DNA-binding transcriptional ArsR family regulator